MNKALLVGINHYAIKPLNGCVNDVEDMAHFLVNKMKFAAADIRLLCDRRATRQAILDRLNWLVTGLKSGDRVVFHYSGHGTQIPARNDKGEVDKLDEAICPVDVASAGGGIDLSKLIVDDEFHALFSAIPKGVKFCWVSDSCHSGTLDRDFTVNDRCIPLPADLKWRTRVAHENEIKPKGFGSDLAAKDDSNFVLITGCTDAQTSSDASFNNRPNGALTYYLLSELGKPSGLTSSVTKVVSKVVSNLHSNNYSQTPQLRGDKRMFEHPFLS